MSATPEIPEPLERMNWKLILAVGVIVLIGGIASLLFPLLASLFATGIAAAAFVLGGVSQLWTAFRGEEGSRNGRLLAGALGALLLIFGLSLWFDPLAGLVSLTILAGAFFLAIGVVRILVALRMRHRRQWTWLIASGGLSALLGLVILFGLPGTAEATLGILLGIELVMSGLAAIFIAWAAREA